MFMCGVLKLEVIFEIGNDCRKIRIICSRSIMQSWPLKDWWRDLIESRNTSSCWSLEDGHCFVLLLLLLVGWWIEHKTKGWMNCESYIEAATCLLCLICRKRMYANMCAKTHGTHTKNACNRCQGGSTRILASASLASQSDLRVAGPVPDILFHTKKKTYDDVEQEHCNNFACEWMWNVEADSFRRPKWLPTSWRHCWLLTHCIPLHHEKRGWNHDGNYRKQKDDKTAPCYLVFSKDGHVQSPWMGIPIGEPAPKTMVLQKLEEVTWSGIKQHPVIHFTIYQCKKRLLWRMALTLIPLS